MKVWIIQYHDWEDDWIIGVFSSKKKAEKRMKEIKTDRVSYDITDYDVDKKVPGK